MAEAIAINKEAGGSAVHSGNPLPVYIPLGWGAAITDGTRYADIVTTGQANAAWTEGLISFGIDATGVFNPLPVVSFPSTISKGVPVFPGIYKSNYGTLTDGQVGPASLTTSGKTIVSIYEAPDFYVRGVVLEGVSLNQIAPIHVSSKSPSGSNAGLLSDTAGNLYTNLAASSFTTSTANSYNASLASLATRTGTIEDLGGKGFIWLAGNADSGGGGSPDVTFTVKFYDVLAGTNLIHTETFTLRTSNTWDAGWRVPAYTQYARVDIKNDNASSALTIKAVVRYATVGDGGDTFEKNIVQIKGDTADTEINSVGVKLAGMDSTNATRMSLQAIENGGGVGVGILSVGVTSLVTGSGSANLGKLEDAAHASGHLGVMGLAVRQSEPTDLSVGATNGDYEPQQVDAEGRTWTNASGRKTRSDVFTTTSNGTTVTATANPLKYFALQVVKSGAVTVWDIRLEGSIDGVNFTQILSHTNTTGDLVTIWVTAPFPCLYFRARCAGITGGTNLTAIILGVT